MPTCSVFSPISINQLKSHICVQRDRTDLNQKNPFGTSLWPCTSSKASFSNCWNLRSAQNVPSKLILTSRSDARLQCKNHQRLPRQLCFSMWQTNLSCLHPPHPFLEKRGFISQGFARGKYFNRVIIEDWQRERGRERERSIDDG